MKIGILGKLRQREHVWIHRSSAIIASFGRIDEWPPEQYPARIMEMAEKYDALESKWPNWTKDKAASWAKDALPAFLIDKSAECYRRAFVRIRSDGAIFDEMMDFKQGEALILKSSKEAILDRRFERSLRMERCVGCDVELSETSLVWHRNGMFSCLRPKCAIALFMAKPRIQPARAAGPFGPGESSSLVSDAESVAYLRLRELRKSMTSIDSSLTETYGLEVNDDLIRKAMTYGRRHMK